jgi:DNA-binding ferritin-like protein (Dps family)
MKHHSGMGNNTMNSSQSKFQAHLQNLEKRKELALVQNRVKSLSKSNEKAFKALNKTLVTLEKAERDFEMKEKER